MYCEGRTNDLLSTRRTYTVKSEAGVPRALPSPSRLRASPKGRHQDAASDPVAIYIHRQTVHAPEPTPINDHLILGVGLERGIGLN